MKVDRPVHLISRAIKTLQNASGWKRWFYAVGFGSVMALSMPPFNLFPLLWFCLPALVLLLQSAKTNKEAFLTGWGFGLGFLTFSLYWIAASMMVDLDKFWWAIPLSVLGLPACFALYNGIVALIAWRLGVTGVVGAVTFGLLWFLGDEIRGNAFSGFPWNLMGYTWSGVLPVLQITSVVGIYGLSLMTSLAASMPAALIDRSKASRIATFAGVALFACLAIGGEVRLMTTKITTVPDVRLRLVQPNIDQAKKWLKEERQKDFDATLDLTAQPVAPNEKPITHVIWPETGSTYYLMEDPEHRQQIADRIPAAATVITGIIRRDYDAKGNTQFYNSIVAIDGLGRAVALYDKAHLVPFGEYMPERRFIPIKAIAADIGDFTPGEGPRSLRVLGLPPFSPLICYEAIFPGKIIDQTDRPDFIVNATNDAWYGDTIGPYQHFAIARVRSIEEGLSLVRAANTGISAVVDPVGRITQHLDLGSRGVIDTDLFAPLPPTVYAKWSELPVRVAFLLITLALGWIRVKKIMKT